MKKYLSVLAQQWCWLKWPVAGALLVFLFNQNRSGFLELYERSPDWGYFGAAFLIGGLSIALTFVRWYLLVWAQDFPFRLRDAFRLGFLGYLFNYVAPGAVGGDLVKGLVIAREQESRRTVAVATVLLDRILGLLALFLVGSVASLFQPQAWSDPSLRLVAIVMAGSAIAGIIGLVVMLHPATPESRLVAWMSQLKYVGGPIAELVNGVRLYQTRRGVVVLAILVSIVGHFGMLSAFYFCSQSLQLAEGVPGYWTHILLIPAAEVIGVVVPLPGGLAALEAAVAHCYVVADAAIGMNVGESVARQAGFLTATLYRVISVVLAAIGGVYYFSSRREIQSVIEEANQVATPELSMAES